MQFGFKRGAAALTLSQTNWGGEVSGELCGVTPMLGFFLGRDCAARHPADFDSVSTAGAQALVMSHVVCHDIRASQGQHCTAECRFSLCEH